MHQKREAVRGSMGFYNFLSFSSVEASRSQLLPRDYIESLTLIEASKTYIDARY